MIRPTRPSLVTRITSVALRLATASALWAGGRGGSIYSGLGVEVIRPILGRQSLVYTNRVHHEKASFAFGQTGPCTPGINIYLV